MDNIQTFRQTPNAKPKTSPGRPLSLKKEQLEKLQNLYFTSTLSIRKLAQVIGTSRSAIERAIKADFYGY